MVDFNFAYILCQWPPGIDGRGEQGVEHGGRHREAVLVLLEHGLAGALPHGPVDVQDGVAAGQRVGHARHRLLQEAAEAGDAGGVAPDALDLLTAGEVCGEAEPNCEPCREEISLLTHNCNLVLVETTAILI